MNAVARQAPSLFSIDLGNANSRPYKSIDRVSWQDIPPFAVLTGRNGSGKTQFLQVLAYKLSYVSRPMQPIPELSEMPLTVSGIDIGPHEVAYLPNVENAFRIETCSIGSIHQAKQAFLSRLTRERVAHDIEAQILRERVQRRFDIQIDSRVSDDMLAKLPDDFTYMLEFGEVSASLGHVFVGYQVRRAEKLMEGQSEERILQDLGRPPWEYVNDALASAEFGYRITPPENKLLKDYFVRLTTIDGNLPLQLNDLSSGEKTILRTLLWFYNSKHNNIFPKLLLLDEPDAHLHPSMTRQFIDVLRNVLVDQYHVRIILTTHSPSTVALAPDESVFVMSREQPRIRRPASQAEAIGLLTSGLVIVSPGTKYVFVEDENDVKFYNAVRDVLSDQGPNRDKKALKPAPSLVFMAASIGKGKEKVPGGKTVVPQWIEKFVNAPLNELFRGIIDLDDGNTSGPRISVLSRYSIENYQLDAPVVFGVLIEERMAPVLPPIAITPGDEHLLRSLAASELQGVADYVVQRIQPELGSLSIDEKVVVEVKYTNGIDLRYPKWMLIRRGHDLLPMYQKVFGQMVITPPKLERMFRRVRLVPVELAHIMSKLQSD